MFTTPPFAEWSLRDCRATPSTKLPAPHQRAALQKLNGWYEREPDPGDGGILVLPTGGGKTFTAIQFLCNGPLSDGYKVLWLAHTHHLLEQAFLGFAAEALGHIREPRQSLRIRVVSGTPGHYPPRDIQPADDVVIATLQTVTNAFREDLRQLRHFIDSAKGKLFVVFDEAHHSPAPSYRKLLLALRERGARVLGLTATPTYTDESKRGWLKKLFPQGILAQARPAELIAQGILAKPHFEQAKTSFAPDFNDAEYQKWIGTYRDIPEHIVDHLAKNAERNQFIANTYVGNRERFGKTIIFTDRWFQCEAIVEALKKRAVRADAIYSHVSGQPDFAAGRRERTADDNARVLDQFRRNELDVLVNVRMLTEGTDIPDAQTVFLTRQTTSQILVTQMVGRALRGPRFGGTPNAYIVSFVDDWQQAIRWAEYDPLSEEDADGGDQTRRERPPLQLISIDLIKRLARQMDAGLNVTPGPFTSLMPLGWYLAAYDVAPGDEIELQKQLVMVFDDERDGFEKLVRDLVDEPPQDFADEAVRFDDHKAQLEAWRDEYVPEAARAKADLLVDIFHLARHIGQGRGAPQFFGFEVREQHDLDGLARECIDGDFGPRAISVRLRSEFARTDRFWRVLFPRFEMFRSYFDACLARILTLPGERGPTIEPRPSESPSSVELDDLIREQVKRRDGYCCLACGSEAKLQVDHIVPVYHGGSNSLDNLQTLCSLCNSRKRTRTLRFTSHQTTLAAAPTELEQIDVPDDAGDRAEWERFLRQTLNFTFECAAVSDVGIAARGDGYYNWNVELVTGNSTAWLRPHLPALLARIQSARVDAGKPAIRSLTVVTPGEAPVTVRSDTARNEVRQGTSSKPRSARGGGGLNAPMSLSPALVALVGEDHLSRTEVVKRVWAYIKANNLQDAEEKRIIHADAKLRPIFGGKNIVTMFEMTKLLNAQLR